ncbi:exodeoxyribonuclease VII large subunit [Planococcus lenghuensis]|uniref:Exodeoxyribonuclease 7 large subunit n=1 Tax=Planococcus lenghuensis TaxID=2213202 RepID=A0A1Q2KY42_9BACL|nr:exodeoxyribonuclease VII large subunit [Planococcus lenghuensis]AQQ53024.1 exodeoxyribonuclease VII large subunit [Planococcus lenghuensis]
MSADSYLSVRALTKYIKRKFDADPYLRDVHIKGELSNVKIHTSGHIYFTLKDNAARLSGIMFAAQANKVKFRPESGMTVLIRGDVTVYETSGQYQLYAQIMQADGIGDYYLAFEQLKEKLAKEGLFEAGRKRRLPRFPKEIAVITAPTGAAVRDIVTTLNRRYPLAKVIIYPTLVQGGQAAASIVGSIQAANRNGHDVIIAGRGGGSIEDLWAFNEEAVARAIVDSRIPVISAVGHETDTTIADFAADLRAPTPTAAAELAVPSRQELLERLLGAKSWLYKQSAARLEQEHKALDRLRSSFPLAHPDRLYRPFIERADRAEDALRRAMQQHLGEQQDGYANLRYKLGRLSPGVKVTGLQQELGYLEKRLSRQMAVLHRERKAQLSGAIRTLDALSPLKIMDRGYSITYLDNELIKSADQAKPGDELEIRLHDGSLKAEVKEKTVKDDKGANQHGRK